MRGSLDARHPVPGARSPEPYAFLTHAKHACHDHRMPCLRIRAQAEAIAPWDETAAQAASERAARSEEYRAARDGTLAFASSARLTRALHDCASGADVS